MKTRLKFACLALSLTLCAALLTACGGGASKSGAGASGKATKVSDVETLLESIAPGAEIVIAPGRYNITEALPEILGAKEQDLYDWNLEHPYVELSDCYDGAEVIIHDVDGLSISGGGAVQDTEIVIDPQYGTVLTFQNCKNVKLSSLTMGHTVTGYCAGNVVDLSACENVELRDMDLYGCGVIGLECSDGTGDVFVYNTVLRDCSEAPLQIFSGVGKFEFYDCVLTGCEGGGYYDNAGRSELSFHNCTFGERESNYWAFANGVKTENCTWSEATEYPDYDPGYVAEYDAPESLPDDLRPLTFDPESHTEMAWRCYQLQDAETGNPLDIPSGGSASEVLFILRHDGTGVISGYYADRFLPFLWEQSGAATLSLTTLHDGILTATLYDTESGSDSYLWLSVRIGDALLWAY